MHQKSQSNQSQSNQSQSNQSRPNQSRPKQILLSSLTVLSCFIGTTIPLPPAAAQLTEIEAAPFHALLDPDLQARIKIPKNTGNSGAPRRRVAGGSRDTCQKNPDLPAIIALVPQTIFGHTTQAQPTLWFYLPYLPEETLNLEFELEDEQAKTKQQLPLTLKAQHPGIISVQVPQTMALEPNREYRWLLRITCDDGPANVPETLMGIIKRIPTSPELEDALSQAATPRERWIAYAEQAIWFDGLTELGSLYQADPENPRLQKDWYTLLSRLNVEDADALLAKQTLQACCSPKNPAKDDANQAIKQKRTQSNQGGIRAQNPKEKLR